MGDDAYAEQVVKDFARDSIDQTHSAKYREKELLWRGCLLTRKTERTLSGDAS